MAFMGTFFDVAVMDNFGVQKETGLGCYPAL